jgi:hypothetical protein
MSDIRKPLGRRRLVLAAALSLLVAAVADARQSTLTATEQRQQRVLETSRTIQAAPGVTSPYALPVPEITLQTTKEGTEATAVIGVSNPFWGFRTTFKTPIGKEDDAEAAPLSLSGLGNQATVDFAVIRSRIFRDDPGIDRARLALCARNGIPAGKCSDQAFTGTQREQFLDLGMQAHPTVFTAHVQIGGKSFDFVDPGGATKQTEKFTSIAAGGSYGWLLLSSQSVFAVNVDLARDYDGSQDTTLLCQPIATDVSGTERCDSRTIGRPTASRKVTTTLDFRKVFTRLEPVPAKPGVGDKPPTPSPIPEQSVPVVGMSLQLRVQAAQDEKVVWGLEAPVYFLQKKPDQNKSVSLNGGASAGWNSKDGFVARVFIGPAFGLLGKNFGQ